MKPEYLFTMEREDGVPFVIYKAPNASNPDPGDGTALHLYVVYGPTQGDFPGKYVVRREVVKPGGRIEVDIDLTGMADDLITVRGTIPPGKVRLPRDPEDPPFILETWV